MMMFKKTFLKEISIGYDGEQEFEIISQLISDLNKYIQNSYDIENNLLYSKDEKAEILQKRYEHATRAWQKHIQPRLEKFKEMSPDNVKFLPKILTIPAPK